MELTQARVRELFEYREDGNLIWKKATSNRAKAGSVAGSKRKNGYLFVSVDGKKIGVHRLVYLFHHGILPDEIDHVDLDPSNNRVSNLRAATRSENNMNRSKQSNNSSGHKGVFWSKERNRWIARITAEGKTIQLGRFKDIEDAVAAYANAASKYHGEFARAT